MENDRQLWQAFKQGDRHRILRSLENHKKLITTEEHEETLPFQLVASTEALP